MMPEVNENLAFYLEAIGKFPLLTPEEEKTASRESLILANLKLAVHIAKNYSYKTDQLLDNIQNANEGLIKAADHYDPSRGKFSVCASYYIRAEIRNRRQNSLGKNVRTREELPETTSFDDLLREIENHHSMVEEAEKHLIWKIANNKLTQKQRKVLEARLFGYTHQEIADTYGISYQAVQQLERKAVETIKNAQ